MGILERQYCLFSTDPKQIDEGREGDTMNTEHSVLGKQVVVRRTD